MNVFEKISLLVTKHGVSPTIRPPNDRVQRGGAKLSKTKTLRFQKSRVKTMLIFFFDAEGVIRREFVPEGQKVNAEFYVDVLDRLLKRIRRVRTAKFQSFFTITRLIITLQL